VEAAQCLAAAILSRARSEADERRSGCALAYFPNRSPIGAVRRKHLIHSARQLAERYGLIDEVTGWIYAAGKEAITGLDVVELGALVGWLERAAERIETTCDRADTPPAR